MTKQQVREYAKKLTKELSVDDITSKSRLISDLFFEEFTITNQDIHVFLTKAKSHEVDTRFIIDKLLFEFPITNLITSVSNFNDYSLTHYLFDKSTTFVLNKYGIPEPVDGKAYQRTPDIILVPLLGYDKRGNRVGFGKGFYDRFLNLCPTSFKVGLSLLQPVEEIEDVDNWDEKLDYCIHPGGVIAF